MLRNAKELEGFALNATDGLIGHVRDFYFDDESWAIRYAVVDTGGWLSGRKVLVSPMAFGTPDGSGKVLPVSISREQVRNSPDIDTDRPVSRQHEVEFSSYYGYPYYWGGAGYWGGGMYPSLVPGDGELPFWQSRPTHEEEEMARREAALHAHDDPHLRSCNAVVGNHVHASDGDIGHIKGMLIDEQTWAVHYFIIDTSNWWLGHQVLIAPPWIEAARWFDGSVTVAMTRQAIRDAPEYDPQAGLNRQEEERLYLHYGQSGYWTDHPLGETEISRT